MDNPVFDFWNKLMVDMWSNYAKPPVSPFAWFTESDRGKGPWQIPLKISRAISDSFAAFAGDKRYGDSDAHSLEDLVSNLMQMGFTGYLDLQKKWLDDVRKGIPPFQDMKSLSHAPLSWLESVRKLFDLVPNAVEGGSSRDFLVKSTDFSAKMSELLYQLYLPMDKASKAWTENMEDVHGGGIVPQNIEGASDVWFSVLESSYLDLLKSPEYAQLLHETADAFEQCRQAQRRVYGPFSKAGSKPQEKGMGTLSEEISKLREKLDELLQKVGSDNHPA